MNRKTANLSISYLGGGYDFPQFFEHSEVRILAEGLPISVECEVSGNGAAWQFSKSCSKGEGPSPLQHLGTGLGVSAARHLSFIRAQFPQAPWRDQIDAAIQLNGLQTGGWQDVIASAYEGLVVIVLHKNDWSVYPLRDLALVLHPYRRLYKIPAEDKNKAYNIFVNTRCREGTCDEIQSLTRRGVAALKEGDIAVFGETVKHAWEIKKQWHPDIVNDTIVQMEAIVAETGAWGWKACDSGYFLVLGDAECHRHIRKYYNQFEVTNGNISNHSCPRR